MSATVKIKQTRSLIGASPNQRRTLAALGLGRIRQERTLPDNASVRGMIENVKHMVEVSAS
ncbi:MAG: 50S ribosomal protein L30 [Desulfovibrionaceae bacterium]|nr:50S ribosomal protein L30 [Desulfovibrionaceae bacterium]MBF0514366.1 50S ribosomal protein L30 [Desulfovibrionaceae bacterium]